MDTDTLDNGSDSSIDVWPEIFSLLLGGQSCHDINGDQSANAPGVDKIPP